MISATVPGFIQWMFSSTMWRVKGEEKCIYLTFDDGPTPVVTEWVLDLLKSYLAQATFFCIGENVEKYRAIFERTIAEGHAVGNHSYTHPDGWKTETNSYIKNVHRASKIIDSRLFRPPYAHLKPAQYQKLKREYQIVAWDVLTWDFDPTVSKEQCLQNVFDYTKAGSIIVFHDYERTFEKLQYALPKILRHYTKMGYQFKAIKI